MVASDAIRQTRANILAVLAHHRFPPITVLTAQSDRLTATVPEGFRAALRRAPFKAWPFVDGHGTTALVSWRECCPRYSLQVIEHRGDLWEFDIDYWNPHPGEGLAFTIGHAAEVVLNWIRRRKSDPFKVRKGLLKRGILVPAIW